jgi:cytochrome c oxidase subunit 2
MLILCTVIFVAVFAVMFYSVWKHRKSKGHQAANFHESVTVEIVWTVIPFIIVILMALPATKLLVAQKDTTNADLTIKATGIPVEMGLRLPQGRGRGHRLHLDAGQRCTASCPTLASPRVTTTCSRWTTPWWCRWARRSASSPPPTTSSTPSPCRQFGIKQDAIPGFVRDTWFRAEKTGDFYGQCQELCGKEHAYMPIHVKVLSAQDYTQWVEGEKKKLAAKADDPTKVWTQADLVARGEKVYAANCAACHQASGKGAGPIKPLDGAAVVLDADKGKQIAVLLNGQNNGAMPAWKQLSDTEIAAVITFTKNNWSNKTGQVVQPADVKTARK